MATQLSVMASESDIFTLDSIDNAYAYYYIRNYKQFHKTIQPESMRIGIIYCWNTNLGTPDKTLHISTLVIRRGLGLIARTPLVADFDVQPSPHYGPE